MRQTVQPHTFCVSTACFRQDISAALFCSCKLLWRCDDCVLLHCFNAHLDIFAVMNCCVEALSVFSSDMLTWSADSLYSVQWHKLREVRVDEHSYYVINFAKMLVWKHEYDVKLWRHKQLTPNENDRICHWMKPLPWKFSAYATVGSGIVFVLMVYSKQWPIIIFFDAAFLLQCESSFARYSIVTSKHKNRKMLCDE